MTYRALDLFCGGGGAAQGLVAAGFQVVGVDLAVTKSHPTGSVARARKHQAVYPGDFVMGDAMRPPFRLQDFDFVWASPPCQAFSVGIHRYQGQAPAKRAAMTAHLLPDCRKLLQAEMPTGMWVIENVPQAPLRPDVRLTGPMFNLAIERERWFELGWTLSELVPPPLHLPVGAFKRLEAFTITKSLCAPSHYYPRVQAGLPGRLPVAEARRVMGVTAPLDSAQVGESVPPAYAEYIGGIARREIERRRATE